MALWSGFSHKEVQTFHLIRHNNHGYSIRRHERKFVNNLNLNFNEQGSVRSV